MKFTFDTPKTRQPRDDFPQLNDPTGWSSNEAHSSSSAFNFYAKSADVNSSWSSINQVVTGGHPFYVAFVWGSAPPP